MFEHVLDRAGLDAVDELVASDGVLMLHTVVCERILQDPNWFYINTMKHAGLHTNKSMSILMGVVGVFCMRLLASRKMLVSL